MRVYIYVCIYIKYAIDITITVDRVKSLLCL